MNVSTPVSVSVNLSASSPPFLDHVIVSSSASVAASVVTVVTFSATEIGDVVVISGALPVVWRVKRILAMRRSVNLFPFRMLCMTPCGLVGSLSYAKAEPSSVPASQG